MRRNFVYLFSINLIVLGFSFLLYKIIPSLYGQKYFLEFSFLKRYQTFLLPLALAGVAVTLPRLASKNIYSASRYLFYSVGIVFLASGLIFFAFWELEDIFVKNASFERNFIEYLIYLTLPLIIPSVLFSYYRGVGLIGVGGISLIWYGVALPILGLFFSTSFYSFCRNVCLMALVCSLFQLLFILKRDPISTTLINLRDFWVFFRDSVSRLPGDLGIQLILILPVFFAARRAGFETTGSLAFVMTLLGMAAFPFKPLSTLLLTEVGRDRDNKRILLIYSKAKWYSTIFGLLGSTLFFFISPIFLDFFGATLSSEGALIFSICMVLYIRYISIRSFVDGLGARSETSNIILLALVSYLLAQLVMHVITNSVDLYALVPFAFSLFVLDTLLNRSVKKFIKNNG